MMLSALRRLSLRRAALRPVLRSCFSSASSSDAANSSNKTQSSIGSSVGEVDADADEFGGMDAAANEWEEAVAHMMHADLKLMDGMDVGEVDSHEAWDVVMDQYERIHDAQAEVMSQYAATLQQQVDAAIIEDMEQPGQRDVSVRVTGDVDELEDMISGRAQDDEAERRATPAPPSTTTTAQSSAAAATVIDDILLAHGSTQRQQGDGERELASVDTRGRGYFGTEEEIVKAGVRPTFHNTRGIRVSRAVHDIVVTSLEDGEVSISLLPEAEASPDEQMEFDLMAPRWSFSIDRVRMSPDLRVATCYYRMHEDDSVVEGLKRSQLRIGSLSEDARARLRARHRRLYQKHSGAVCVREMVEVALARATPQLRWILGRQLNTKFVPDLDFQMDSTSMAMAKRKRYVDFAMREMESRLRRWGMDVDDIQHSTSVPPPTPRRPPGARFRKPIKYRSNDEDEDADGH